MPETVRQQRIRSGKRKLVKPVSYSHCLFKQYEVCQSVLRHVHDESGSSRGTVYSHLVSRSDKPQVGLCARNWNRREQKNKYFVFGGRKVCLATRDDTITIRVLVTALSSLLSTVM
jgi:hypothetical protein